MTTPLTDADLAAMEARADARVRWCEWAPTRLAPPSEFCGAACVVRCDGCAVTRCAAHAEECDGGCVHAWTTLDESAADLRVALAEVRRLRSPWRDEPPTLAEVEAHSAATDAATGSTWGVWLADPVNTLGACPRVVLLRAMHDGGGVWAHVDGERAVALPDALAALGAVRWLRWLFGPAGWSP